MLRAYKTEILPTSDQALKIRKTIGICRYLYNLYLARNFELYETLDKGFFVTGYTFDKYVNHVKKPQSEGIGIDLGVKDLAIMSNGVVKPNINKTPKVIKLNRKLRREQRCLSRKYENKKRRGEKTAAKFANIEKQVVKINLMMNAELKMRNNA